MATIKHPLDSDSDEEDGKLSRSRGEEMGVIRCLELISAVNVLLSATGGSAQDDFNKILRETFKDKTDDLLGKISDSHALFANMKKILTQTKSVSFSDFYSLTLKLSSLLDENAGFLFDKISGSEHDLSRIVFSQLVRIKEAAKGVNDLFVKSGSDLFVKSDSVEELNFLIEGLHSILHVVGTGVRLPDGEKRKFEDYFESVCLVDFYKAYDKKLQALTKGVIGWFREKIIRSDIPRDWNLEQIIAHALSGGERTLGVLKDDLKWLGTVKGTDYGRPGERGPDVYGYRKTAPDAFKEAFIAYCEGPEMTPDPTPDSTPRTSVLDKSSSATSPRGSR